LAFAARHEFRDVGLTIEDFVANPVKTDQPRLAFAMQGDAVGDAGDQPLFDDFGLRISFFKIAHVPPFIENAFGDSYHTPSNSARGAVHVGQPLDGNQTGCPKSGGVKKTKSGG
ncbi:MAG: hypothetical protein HYR56_34055, partial [Acidobacteria bacterium]|nr:hypothetical protein [Acidobacteriota bacterium]